MKFDISHDGRCTHIDWTLDGVTAQMIDWFWSNMEKGFILWHPEEHEILEWPVPVKHGDLRGAVHNAPQTWSDGRRQDLFIRFEPLESLTPDERDLITHSHVLVACGLGLSEEEWHRNDPMGFRIHQWSPSDNGVVGRSSAVPRRRKETVEDGRVWAQHAAQEVGNWEAFLPDLFNMYRVVKKPEINPFTDLSVTGSGREARYVNMD